MPYREACILIVGENFGCGSSREHAPWALLDFGIRCIIASGFADIFYGNCFKNGILPIILPAALCDDLRADAERGEAGISVDLVRQVILRPDGSSVSFTLDPVQRHKLLSGLDDIASTLQRSAKTDAYERRVAAEDRPYPAFTFG